MSDLTDIIKYDIKHKLNALAKNTLSLADGLGTGLTIPFFGRTVGNHFLDRDFKDNGFRENCFYCGMSIGVGAHLAGQILIYTDLELFNKMAIPYVSAIVIGNVLDNTVQYGRSLHNQVMQRRKDAQHDYMSTRRHPSI
jgi:hypothetical protein